MPRLKNADWLVDRPIGCLSTSQPFRNGVRCYFLLINQPLRNVVGLLVGRRVRLSRVADGWLAPGCERAGVATGGVSRQVLWRGEQHLGC